MEIEKIYQLAQLDPPEIDDSDAIASEVVVYIPNQVEQAVEPVVVEQILLPIAEEQIVKKKRERKKKWSSRKVKWLNKKGSGNPK